MATVPATARREYSFAAYSATNPQNPHSGDRLDAEFDRTNGLVNAAVAFSRTIQSDSGALKPNTVGVEQLNAALRLLVGAWTPRGTWVSGTAYAARDMIVGPDGRVYVCVVGHTASVAFATDTGAGRWQLVFGDTTEITSATHVLASGGTTTASLANRFGDMLNVKRDFGAVGDGVTDDTAAFIAAAATGRSYVIPASPAGYRITGQVTHAGFGQWVYGQGQASPIIGVGGFNTFVFTGNQDTCGLDNVYFSSLGKTSGYDVVVDFSYRVRLQRVWCAQPYRGIYIGRTNNAILDDIIVTRYRGGAGIQCYGTDAAPCGIISLANYRCSPSTTGISGPAMDIEGRVSTLFLNGFQVNGNGMSHGLRARNSIGAAHGLRFLWGYDVEIDFPDSHGIDLEDSLAVYIMGGYVQGTSDDRSASDPPGHGIRIGPNTQVTRISGMHMRGLSGHGILVEGQDVLIEGNDILGASWIPELGKYDGVHIASTAQRVRVHGNRIGNAVGAGATARIGVYAAPGARNVSVVGNDLNGCRVAPLRDDSGLGAGNFDQSGNAGVAYSQDGATVFGSQTGFRGAATPVLSGGGFTGVTVTDPGFHYEVPPTVAAYDPAGTGAGATFEAFVANGKITGISVLTAGTNYGPDTLLTITSANGPPSLRALSPPSTDVALAVVAQGVGAVQLGNENGDALVATAPANAVNFLTVTGGVAGDEVSVFPGGTDADIGLALLTKGNGLLRLPNTTQPAAGTVVAYLQVLIGGAVRKIPLYD